MNLEKYRRLFIEEASERVAHLAAELAPGPPFDRQALDSLFRHAHSIKGMSAAMRVDAIRDLAHAMEDRLAAARALVHPLGAAARDRLLAAVDLLAAQIEAYESGAELATNSDLMLQLRAGQTEGTAADPAAERPATTDPKRADRRVDQPIDAASRETAPAPPSAAVRERSIRIETRFADRFHDHITDLTHGFHTLHEAISRGGSEAAVRAALETARRILDSLRADSIAMRLVRFDAIAPELARAARESAASVGKQVEFRLEGGDVSLDRAIADALVDPLVHLIRNAVDHGIEPPDRRVRAGKPESGRLTLCARRDSESIEVVLEDDGAGLDRAALCRKAGEAGIRVDALSDNEVLLLATAPGLTTAAAVTKLSGRGVGLDLVRAAIEGLGGRLEIRSTAGAGTAFTLRAPLTLALQRLLVVVLGGQRFAVQRRQIRRVVRLDPGAVSGPGQRPLLLGDLLALPPSAAAAEVALEAERPDGRTVLIAVDEVVAEQELVVRPLGRPLQRLPGFSAAALLPDGQVALVIDFDGLLERALPSDG